MSIHEQESWVNIVQIITDFFHCHTHVTHGCHFGSDCLLNAVSVHFCKSYVIGFFCNLLIMLFTDVIYKLLNVMPFHNELPEKLRDNQTDRIRTMLNHIKIYCHIVLEKLMTMTITVKITFLHFFSH